MKGVDYADAVDNLRCDGTGPVQLHDEVSCIQTSHSRLSDKQIGLVHGISLRRNVVIFRLRWFELFTYATTSNC